jgi:hypothetical protein
MNLSLTQISKNSDSCFWACQFNFLCGCNNGERLYWSADTETKKAPLAWISRVSGLVSLVIGSLSIFWNVSRDKKKPELTYHQLVVAMSLIGRAVRHGYSLLLPFPNIKTGLKLEFMAPLGTIPPVSYKVFSISWDRWVVPFVQSHAQCVLWRCDRQGLPRVASQIVTPMVSCSLHRGFLACAGIPYYQSVILMCHIGRPSTSKTQSSSNQCLCSRSLGGDLGWSLLQYGEGVLGCLATKSGGPKMVHTTNGQ